MRRGDLVVVALQGDFGKPRPALVVRADLFAGLPSTAICPLTSTPPPYEGGQLRIPVSPTAANGLRRLSHVAMDRITTARLSKVGPAIGRVESDVMRAVDRALAVYLGIA